MQYDYTTKSERNNHKTMRIPDLSLEFIMTFEGNTFNDQVNNMIDFFMNSKSTYEQELKRLDEKIKYKKDLLTQIEQSSFKLNKVLIEINKEIHELKY